MHDQRPALNFGTQIWRWTEGKYYEMLDRVKSFGIGTNVMRPEWLVQLTREDPENNELVNETYFLVRMELGSGHRLSCQLFMMPIPEGYEPHELKVETELLNYRR